MCFTFLYVAARVRLLFLTPPHELIRVSRFLARCALVSLGAALAVIA